MRADLERNEFMEILERLKSEDDADVLAAVRDINAKMTVAGVTWDDLLASQDDGPAAPSPDYDDDDDDDGQEDGIVTSGDEDSDADLEPLNDEEKQEVKDLIAALRALEISDATKEDLAEYETDLADGELEVMDLRYLRALKARLNG